jgi:hypothetical protein
MRILFLILFLVSPEAWAFSTTGYYFVATEPAELGLDSLTRWGGEATSDFVTYLPPLTWDSLWWRRERSLELSVGSLSSHHFFDYHRVQLRKALSESLEFRFFHLRERDYELDRSVLPLELSWRIAGPFRAVIFGTTSLYKSELDLGLAAEAIWPVWQARLSALWGDFQRNKRSTTGDSWSRSPLALTASLLWLGEGADFLRGEWHWERPNRRVMGAVPLRDLEYRSLVVQGIWAPFALRFLHDDGYTFDHSVRAGTRRRRSLGQVEYGWDPGFGRLRPGLHLAYREFQGSGMPIYLREALPFFWYEVPGAFLEGGRWSVGYDSALFQREHQDREDNDWNQRLNVKSDWRFARAGELALLLTFDLDRLGTSETWEGGAAQFRIDF